MRSAAFSIRSSTVEKVTKSNLWRGGGVVVGDRPDALRSEAIRQPIEMGLRGYG